MKQALSLLEFMDEVLSEEKDEGADMFPDVVADTTWYFFISNPFPKIA